MRPHGHSFEYRSIETDVIAFAMERVTGKRLPELVSEEIWQKIGADESAYFTVDSAGYALADGGFNATTKAILPIFPKLTEAERWRSSFALMPPSLCFGTAPDQALGARACS